MKRDLVSNLNSKVILAALAVSFLAAGWAAAGECRPGDPYGHGPRYRAPAYHVPVARKPYVAAPYRDGAPKFYAELKVVDIRWIDAGLPEEKLGPAFRLVLRNVGGPLHKFDLLLTAAAGDKLNPEFPTAVETIAELYPGQVLTIDMRMPIESFAMAYPGQKAPAPFDTVIVLAATSKEDVKTLAVVPRAKILPVDLALFEMDNYTFPAGATMFVKGEGFALEPGKVVVQAAGLNLAAEILSWGPLGVEVKLPHLPLARLTRARMFVVRTDGMVSRPLPIDLDVPVAKPVIGPASAGIAEPVIEPASALIAEPVAQEPAVEAPAEAANEAIEIPAAPLAPVEAPEAAPVEDAPEVDAGASTTTSPSVAKSIAEQLTRLLGR